MRRCSSLLSLLCFALPLCGEDTPPSMTMPTYVEKVLVSNLEAAAQRHNVSIAQAQLSISRVWPDPALNLGMSKELAAAAKPITPNTYSAGVSWTMEMGGKRSARVAVAKKDLSKAQADLDEYLSNLRATAALAYVDALRTKMLLERKQKTMTGFQEVLRINEVRERVGEISALELAQSRLEARRFEVEMLVAKADLGAAEATLGALLGDAKQKIAPEGALEGPMPTLVLEDLMQLALAQRPALIAAKRNLESVEMKQKLARASRWSDLGLSVGVTHTPAVHAGGVETAPMGNNLALGVGIPLPFSRLQKGELLQAQYAKQQAELQYRQAEEMTKVDVKGAFAQWTSATTQLNTFKGGILQDAEKVLDGTLISYKHGASNMLQLILAQRTHNEVYLAHVDSQANALKALVNLDKVCGTRMVLTPVTR